jgi:Arc/MetJ-type ribon-helix-helix transcriptional regulator
MSKEQESKAVSLSAELYGRIEERVRETGFGSVDEYVTFVLNEVLKEEGEETEVAFSKEEEEEVKKRLRALGYLD